MSYLSTVIADSPVHFWRCADPGGGVLNDVGSNPVALTLQGSGPLLAYTGPNSDGGSFVITNNNGFMHFDLETLALPFTAEFWVFKYYNNNAAMCPFDVVDNAGFTMAEFRLGTGGNVQVFTANGTLTYTGPMTTQRWHHIALADDTAGAILYVDGVNQATAGAVAATSKNCYFSMGIEASPVNGLPCAAGLAEGAIYHTKLSAARILAHFNAADNTAQPPISKQFGSFSGSTLLTNTDQLANVVLDISRTYHNAP